MALNYIFIGFFAVGFLVACLRVIGYLFANFFNEFLGIVFTAADGNALGDIVQSTFTMAETSVNIVLYLVGIMTLWLGFMKIGENGGAISKMSKAVHPFFSKLFPELKEHPNVTGSIMMNFSANMLGLDNSATPMGLKAMRDLQMINPQKDTASNAQIMFLVLNTSGLTIIPISVMALRAAEGAANPTDVFIPILLATLIATIVGVLVVAWRQKINVLQAPILITFGGLGVFIASIIAVTQLASETQMALYTQIGGNFILLGVILWFMYLAVKQKVNVYESFIEGAKEGFETSVRIIPYLVGMLVAIGVFRASGAFELVLQGFDFAISAVGLNTDFVPALPTAFMKPLSGSGARAMMLETMNNYGVDSFPAMVSSILQGSTETTFYTLAVYYGAVNISKTRYTVQAGLMADVAGIIAAILLGYLFFH